MEHEQLDRAVARKSAQIYLPLSFGGALLFLLAASMFGNYPLVAKVGGTVWIALLSLIVSMPLVISRVKRQVRENTPTA